MVAVMPLDALEVKHFRSLWGKTQAEFAEIVGVTPNSVARWERGAARVPEPAARFIQLLARVKEEDDALRKRGRRGRI